MKRAVLTLALLLATPTVYADANDPAAAQALFDEGRKLVLEGNCEAAIPKFTASHKLDPSPGPLLNLADCLAKTGRTASAWARFREAASMLKAAGQNDRAAFARQRADELEPSLARLTVRSSEPNVEVLRDGAVLDGAVLGVAVPVDPGAHEIEARAPGKLPYRKRVEVAASASVSVEIPKLADAPIAPAPVADTSSSRRTVAILVGSAGVVGLGFGAAFGLGAASQWSDAKKSCEGTVCDRAGFDAANAAQTSAVRSNIAFALGGVALAAGVVLWITAPSAPRVGVAPGVGTLSVVGRF